MKLSEQLEQTKDIVEVIAPTIPSVTEENIVSIKQQLIQDIKELEAQTQWISVDNRKPKHQQNVLVADGNEVFHVVYDANGNMYYDWVEEYQKFPDVKWWMPLPKPPEDE